MNSNETWIRQIEGVIGIRQQDFISAEKRLRDERKALRKAKTDYLDAKEAQKVVQLVAQTVQQQAHEKISGVVSRCLSAIFDDPYEFKIIFEQKRGKTEARLVFVDDTNELDPISASGGGVVDVAAFALRISAILLSQPPLRRVLIADEPFRFLSEKYRPRMAELLLELSTELKFQFILVTHDVSFMSGKIFSL